MSVVVGGHLWEELNEVFTGVAVLTKTTAESILLCRLASNPRFSRDPPSARLKN